MAKKEKSPAYQHYPKDILTDKNVMRMTLEEEGVFRRLLDYCWLEDGLDNDIQLLASYAKMPGQIEHFREIWKTVRKCFFLRRNKFKNKRQERERKKQKLYSKLQRNKAKGRWNKETPNDAEHMPVHTDRQCFSSSSSFASPPPGLNTTPPISKKLLNTLDSQKKIEEFIPHEV